MLRKQRSHEEEARHTFPRRMLPAFLPSVCFSVAMLNASIDAICLLRGSVLWWGQLHGKSVNARIKKIMQADEDIGKIAMAVPLLLGLVISVGSFHVRLDIHQQ
ncbi:hypothetical protein Taro_032439 [Colocasia esculenta]|uniref:Uncharacterized protein n=1 Tax=Colocasia esculenta TaxID=4460 RepID=A0A843VLB6_COLES|nr:hypothetical protein [Colocasia esculenta]